MDPNLVNLKYNDLRKVAKDLGISNFGEYSGLVSSNISNHLKN